MLQSASIRIPPSLTCKIASGVRSVSHVGPGTASKSVPEAPEGCILFSEKIPQLTTTTRLDGGR
eukprot:6574919-Alexandrium_andersonii.AAC.1